MPASTVSLLSELEAVNIILANMGEPTVNSIDGVGVDAQMARDVLTEISRTVQTAGWHFNREEHTISPDVTGQIFLPANTIKVDTIKADQLTDVVARGLRLFDRVNNTYTFTQSLTVELYVMLPWDELPLYAKNYIVVKSARTFCQRILGSDSHSKWNAEDEARAATSMLQGELDNADYNMLYDSDTISNTLVRRPWGFNFNGY